MGKVSGSDLMRRVKRICGTSVDAGIDILNETILLKAETYQLVLLDACLYHEIQHSNRATMIQKLKERIRKLEKTV
ncbi:MAG: hypothetical protein IMF10_09300 [Proteobacteria bacterium]|nr:hypothetical protein [Pseudomonadota bacterium]